MLLARRVREVVVMTSFLSNRVRARRSFDDSSYAADLKRRRRQLLDLFSMLHVAAEPFTRPESRLLWLQQVRACAPPSGRLCLLNPSTTSSLVHSRAVPRNAKAVMHDAAAHDGGSRVDQRLCGRPSMCARRS